MSGDRVNDDIEGGGFMKKEDKELTDIQLRDALLNELDKDPKVTSTEIGVGVSHGVITLTGYVHTDVERREAERVARKVAGVLDVANDIQVRPYTIQTDSEIALAARQMLESRLNVAADRISVSVTENVLTLGGEVDDNNQRMAVEDAVRHLGGIRGIRNQITLKKRAMGK
jgi:osmotically-inducible protein OsmY